jgi:succinate dehydrogenase/fumarate reductase flavoprotein subunit
MDDIDEKDGRPMSEIDETEVKGEKKGLTRRSFLGSAAVGAAAVSVSGGLMGVPAALASGSEWSEKDAENIVWDRETDLLVLGSGYAAFCAAIEAYDAGVHDILIVDKAKANAIGGNSILCAGAAQFAGTDIEKAQVPAPAGYPDTPNDTAQWMYEDSLSFGDYRAQKDVLRSITATSQSTIDWLRNLGLAFRPTTSFQLGMRPTVARTHQPGPCPITDTTDPKWYPGNSGISYWYVMYNGLRARGFSLGTNILTEHKAVKFIQAGNDGPVVGMEVQDIAGGKTLNIRTRRAVFIGAGGWKSNAAMRTNWDPRLDEDFGAGGLPYVETTGEVIMAANDIGADLTGMDYVCEFRVKWGTRKYQNWDNNITHPTTGTGLSMNFDKGIAVGIDGKRFIDEYTTAVYEADAQRFCEAFACMQKPRAVWGILDADSVTAAWTGALASPNPDVTPCVSADMIYSGATIAELAGKMGVSAAGLQAEITKYNGFVTAKLDQDFGRPSAHMTAQIAKAPFYACKAQFFAHDQMSGITVNVAGQVIKRVSHRGPTMVPLAQQEVIPRLYAAGECCGGYYGTERGHGKIGLIMNAARIVGKEAAKEAPVGVKATSLAVKSSAASAVHGHSVTLAGVLSGPEGVPAGGLVSLQVRVPGKSQYATLSPAMPISAARTVSKSYKLAKQGTYYFRMQFAGSPSFQPCTSTEVKVVSK